jgi:hypothetical protein
VYNWALGLKIEHYKKTKKGLYRSELQKRLVAKKKEEQFGRLSEVNQHCDIFNQLLRVFSNTTVVTRNSKKEQPATIFSMPTTCDGRF